MRHQCPAAPWLCFPDLLRLRFRPNMNLIYQEAAWINLHCGCEWGVCVCDVGDEGQNRRKVGRTPPLFINPFMPRPSAVMLLSNPRWSQSLSQASISERRGPDRDRTLEASRVCFQGTNLSFCCFLSLNTLSTPEAVFSSTYGDLSPSAAAIVENVAKREINIFESIWIHVPFFPNFLDCFL